MGPQVGLESGKERRKFLRLPYVLPVEFYLVSSDHKKYLSDLIQGFTRNVGRGGLCLEVNNLKEYVSLSDFSGKTHLLLYINLPFSQSPVETYGRVAWLKKANPYPHKFLLGVSYYNIDLPETKRPLRFARLVSLLNRGTILFIILLSLGLAGISSANAVLRRNNKRLINRLVQISKEQSKVSHNIFYLEDLKKVLKTKLKEKEQQIYSLTKEKIKKPFVETILKDKIEKAYKELGDLQKKLNDLEEGEALLKNQIAKIQDKKIDLEGKTTNKMYNWLKIRQNRNTGLVLSYEGDPFLEGWAFTYDQALVAQCFLLFDDFESAERVLDFYKNRAKKIDGGFCNAYDVAGGHVVEYAVHSGPNIWLGLTALQYTDKTGDKTYLPLVEAIANWIINLQDEDPERGVKGGPKLNWYSTEHNLDAYAFLSNLYKITKNKKYLEATQKALSWVKKNAYIKAERRLKRGRGDATIATDTLAWAIATLGPARLIEEEMSPDDILKFAEENCQVTVDYFSSSGGENKITGFDFSKARNIGRGGVVSSEFTAQVVVSFKIMSEFYLRQNNLEKAKLYRDKAEFFLAELDKLLINSSSKTGQGAICLPYATHQNVDTGHGWRTPKGQKTGCIAGTVYAIFAKKNYNPFEIK